MSDHDARVAANRELIVDAQNKGLGATLAAYTKLSGPGWLQSAITLGGGSLAGSLFLGVLSGTSLLWLQLVAIIMGVVMLSAISYVTLSTGEKPFQSINQHINPALGWGWLIATCMANMIWCMPQFSLSYEALQKNLVGGSIDESIGAKLAVSIVLLVAATFVVFLNSNKGLAAKVFDWFLKALIGMVVICFFGVVIYLSMQGQLNWGAIFAGFVPDLSLWTSPAGDVAELLQSLPDNVAGYWSSRIVKEQQDVMIGAAATAVGINMTFLMPYAILNRGWDKPFRGLARFDLSTGMAIPYIIVTSCVVIAASTSFHAKVDENLLSDDPAMVQTSPSFAGIKPVLVARLSNADVGDATFSDLTEGEQLAKIVGLPENEKKIASSLVRRNAFQLSRALAPLLGERNANIVFGMGVLGMGFSTIIILMLINGYAFSEMFGQPQGGPAHYLGCVVAGITGASWFFVWDGPAKMWLAILASSFGMMLLPIAYITFMLMMNSRSILGAEKPTGGRMLLWNFLMGISVIGACIAAGQAVINKASDDTAGPVVIGVGIVYVVLVIVGFVYMAGKKKQAV
ncbi:MAG: divalent metal cation transporter [Planctomycetales bacterium]|nr:divalent metal cation transporter [Planctomycetales bacterium]